MLFLRLVPNIPRVIAIALQRQQLNFVKIDRTREKERDR